MILEKLTESQLIEFVPNFSEGTDLGKIQEIAQELKKIQNVSLLNINISKIANRSVFSIIGDEHSIEKAILKSYELAYNLIDMRYQKGVHPRVGALDVCPLIPLNLSSIDQCNQIIYKTAEVVSNKYQIPIFCYYHSTLQEQNRHIKNIRHGEYENLKQRLNRNIVPDFGINFYNPKFGASIMGVRDLLIAYNINLECLSTEYPKKIASTLRQIRQKRISIDKIIPITSNNLEQTIIDYAKIDLTGINFIGWSHKDFHQISMNIYDYKRCSPYQIFYLVSEIAKIHNCKATTSELIGLIPIESVIHSSIDFYKINNITDKIPNVTDGIISLNFDKKMHNYEMILEYNILEALSNKILYQ